MTKNIIIQNIISASKDAVAEYKSFDYALGSSCNSRALINSSKLNNPGQKSTQLPFSF